MGWMAAFQHQQKKADLVNLESLFCTTLFVNFKYNFITRWHNIQGALDAHRRKLAIALEIHAFNRDIDDINDRINEKVNFRILRSSYHVFTVHLWLLCICDYCAFVITVHLWLLCICDYCAFVISFCYVTSECGCPFCLNCLLLLNEKFKNIYLCSVLA